MYVLTLPSRRSNTDHTVYLQTTPYLHLPHKRSPDGATTDLWWHTSSCSLLLIYRPREDERLSWSGWLTYSGSFTHISGHPSAVGRVEDSESSPVIDQRSTTEPRNQHILSHELNISHYFFVYWLSTVSYLQLDKIVHTVLGKKDTLFFCST